jgi:hypothetical protein
MAMGWAVCIQGSAWAVRGLHCIRDGLGLGWSRARLTMCSSVHGLAFHGLGWPYAGLVMGWAGLAMGLAGLGIGWSWSGFP